MSQRDHQPLELSSSRSALGHAILFFPLRVLVTIASALTWFARRGKPSAPRARFEELSEDEILSRFGKNAGDDLHLLRALFARDAAGGWVAGWTRIRDAGRESVVAQLRNRSLRWTADCTRVAERALDDPLPAVVDGAERALCERIEEWIEREHPNLADSGAFSRPPSPLDHAYLRSHVDRWRASKRPNLKRLAGDVERRLRRAHDLVEVLDRWHSFPRDGSSVARPPFAVSFRIPETLVVASTTGERLELAPATYSGTLAIARSANYAADASLIPAEFELTVADADRRRWRIDVELDDLAIFSAAIEATPSGSRRFFTQAEPEWRARFWENLAIHPSLFAPEGCEGDTFSLPGDRELVVNESDLVAHAVAVLEDPARGAIVAVLVTEMAVQGRAIPPPPFVATIELGTFLFGSGDGEPTIRAHRLE